MNRILCFATAMTMLVALPAAQAEIEIGDLSLDALYELREAVNTRIAELEQQQFSHQYYASGLYHVDEDIPAGDYVLIENEGAVFASVVVRKEAAEDSDLISHHLINGQAVIRLRPDTWVTLLEASAFPVKGVSAYGSGSYGEGGYWVDKTLPAGHYTILPMEKAPLSSYSIYNGILGTNAQLTRFEVLHGAIDIQLNAGDYIELSGCEMTSNETVTEDSDS